MGVVSPSRSITSTEMPASFGVQGPGEITIASTRFLASASTVISSLRCTSTVAPSAPSACTRFQVKLS